MSSKITVSPRALSRAEGVASFLHPGSIYLFQGPRNHLHTAMEEMTERFAMRGKVHIVAGGNWVSFDRLPFLLKEGQGRIYEILDRIMVSRAETCYQMVDVLSALKPSPIPLVITDMLEAFYDEDLTEQETGMLLEKCVLRMGVLSQESPLLISVNPTTRRTNLIERLERIADMRIYLEPPRQSEEVQMGLF